MIYSSVLFRIRVGYKNTKNPLSKYHNMDKILFVNPFAFPEDDGNGNWLNMGNLK